MLAAGSVAGLNQPSNLLAFNLPLHTAWTTRLGGATQYYTLKSAGTSSVGVKTYNMLVNRNTPSDYYALTLQTAGGPVKDGGWSDPEPFYLHVTRAVPEPSTFALMGFGVVGLLVWRRRKHAK